MAFVDHTTVRLDLSDPVDALSYIPYRFGFVPTRSLVFLSIRGDGDHLQVGLAARLDLDDALTPVAGRSLVRRVLAEAEREGARHVITAIFDPELFTELVRTPAGAPPPPAARERSAALADLLSELIETTFSAGGPGGQQRPGARPVSVDLIYLVGEQAWRCLTCRHHPRCPPQGTPRTTLQDSAISAQMVFTGHGIVSSREDLAAVPAVNPGDQDTAQRAGIAALLRDQARSSRSGRDLAHRRAGVIAEWERVLAGSADDLPDLGPARIGALAASLTDVQIRDCVLLAMCTRTPPSYSDPHDLKARLDELFSAAPHPPDDDQPGSALLALMAGHCRGPLLAPVLATWAWYRWWLGDGTSANVLVDRCLGIDPAHQLARLLNQLLRTNARPPWSAAA